MTLQPVSLDELLAVQERMVREIQQGLDDDEQHILRAALVSHKIVNHSDRQEPR